MDYDLAKKNYDAFHFALADLLVTWNSAERAAKRMLNYLCGDSAQTHVLTADFSSMALKNALMAMTAGIVDEQFSPAMRHGIDYFDIVREYRNYYVHGIFCVAAENSDDAFGMIETVAAKQKLTIDEERVPVDQIIEVRMMAGNLASVWTNIYTHFVQNLEGGDLELLPLDTFLERHPLPDRLKKPRRYPLAQPPQPQPSEGITRK